MSPTERGLLAAVQDRPADALTRLVYADWLEGEASDPRRGAYLRAWCAMLAVSVRELDEYAEGAEALESLAEGLDADWLAAVGATRFHLTDYEPVAGRVEAFFLRFGGSCGLIDARVMSIDDAGGGWTVRYITGPDALAFSRGAAVLSKRLGVTRATGRVHMIGADGRPARTHHPDHTAPSRTDGRNP